MTRPWIRTAGGAGALAGALFLTGLVALPASAQPDDGSELLARAAAAAAAGNLQDCVDGGPTSLDVAVAKKLKPKLTGYLDNAMNAYRASCARAVVDAVRARGLGERAAVIAITTVIVETTIQNNTCVCDHTSVGLFQQQEGWGTKAQRLDPKWSTNAFLSAMLEEYPNGSWRTTPIGEVCQGVQHSGFPAKYPTQVADAQRIVDALWLPDATSVYGVLADGRLTYSAIDPANGNRIDTEVSTKKLGFTPKALATLNFNTLLVTNGETGQLFRVDVTKNSTSLLFNDPIVIANDGWVHDLLTYDGHGHLYGIYKGALRRYNLADAGPGGKPTASDITGNTIIEDSGFTLKTLTAAGDDWLLGVSNTGDLRSYKIRGAGDYTGYTLADRWGGFTELVSPGYGVYFGRTSAGGMYHYRDLDPFDGDGDDIAYHTKDPVDASGWTQTLLSAQPVG